MNVQNSAIIECLAHLGKSLRQIPEDIKAKAQIMNPWFTPNFIDLAAHNWSDALMENKIANWLKDENYQLREATAGIIMAGNIPFVLMKFAIDKIIEAMPELSSRIQTEGKLNGIQYLIATGSNNSARYFEYYFRDVPAIIRKNRSSIAVLSGKESSEELELLADDIYTYYGLGCRNVSHLILPEGFALQPLYEAYDKYMDHVHHHKYYNNYMYHKSILLMNLDKHYDNGFMLFQEKQEPHAPIATLNYHYYQNLDEVSTYLNQYQEQWQCVVSNIKGAIALGQSQKPGLSDYADHINLLEFLN